MEPNARPVIVSACRTAIGKFGGALQPFRAPELGSIVIKEALRRAGIEASAVEEVLLGHVLQAGVGQNPARQAARGAGVPDSIGSVTINKVCGSGLKAVMLAAQAIKAGDLSVAVAGGMESMTNAPYLLPTVRFGQRLNHGPMLDAIVQDGLWDLYNDFHMGMTAEKVVEKYAVTRAQQDEFAAASHRKSVAAQKAGKFDAEIVPVPIPQKKGEAVLFRVDEGPRGDSTPEALAKLKPVFKKDGGSVTAGNASSINDGASALVVMSEEKAKALGAKPMARILGYATSGTAPEWVMMAPEVAVKKLCGLLKMGVRDFDLVEINEAFSAQMVALTKVLELDPERVNVHGGAVALGHPIGASGARVLTTLLHALGERKKTRGLAALCLGGGNAVAMAVERIA